MLITSFVQTNKQMAKKDGTIAVKIKIKQLKPTSVSMK